MGLHRPEKKWAFFIGALSFAYPNGKVFRCYLSNSALGLFASIDNTCFVETLTLLRGIQKRNEQTCWWPLPTWRIFFASSCCLTSDQAPRETLKAGAVGWTSFVFSFFGIFYQTRRSDFDLSFFSTKRQRGLFSLSTKKRYFLCPIVPVQFAALLLNVFGK